MQTATDNTTAATPANDALRSNILNALEAFANQRPGLDPRNYLRGWRDADGLRAYRRESRSITRDLHDFRALLAVVRWRSIDAAALLAAFRAYSGRLVCERRGEHGVSLSYCTGAYWPTEYRKAACAVLASALWDHVRDHCMPQPDSVKERQRNGQPESILTYGGYLAGDWLRRYFRREFGARMARRWFD